MRSRQTHKHLLLTFLLINASLTWGGESGVMDLPYTPPVEMKQTTHLLYGRVMKTMDSGGYTYVQLDTGTQKVWAAGPITALKKGDAVSVNTEMPMRHYHSNTLKRDFDLLYFSNVIMVAGRDTGMNGNMNPHQGMQAQSKPDSLAKIKKASHGKTVAEVYREKMKLTGKRVRVRGKVVKYTANVMHNNWLHLRDNSSDKDLVVITRDKTQLDAVVVAEGTVILNKDIGIGPVYELVLEDAKLSDK